MPDLACSRSECWCWYYWSLFSSFKAVPMTSNTSMSWLTLSIILFCTSASSCTSWPTWSPWVAHIVQTRILQFTQISSAILKCYLHTSGLNSSDFGFTMTTCDCCSIISGLYTGSSFFMTNGVGLLPRAVKLNFKEGYLGTSSCFFILRLNLRGGTPEVSPDLRFVN